MAQLARSQLFVYGAVAVALLLLGSRAIRSTPEPEPAHSAPPPLKVERSGGGGLMVHVAGAVQNPGVYRLSANARVTDAVKRAGGARDDANLDGVNLAAKVADGQQIVVPKRAPAGAAAGAAGEGASTGPISLGSATLEQLQQVEGVGPATAEKIIAYRTQHGGFSSVDELDQVSGIGPKKLEALQSQVQP